MNEDIYQEMNILIEDLKKLGFYQESNILADCIEGGATGSEILMSFKYNLSLFLKKEINYPPQIMDSMARLYKFLEKSLM